MRWIATGDPTSGKTATASEIEDASWMSSRLINPIGGTGDSDEA
jgi:hypothetical protein